MSPEIHCSVQDSAAVSIREEGLDLAPYFAQAAVKAAGSCLYDLFGVVCHFGSLEGGHYTACTCTSQVGALWGDSLWLGCLYDLFGVVCCFGSLLVQAALCRQGPCWLHCCL